MSKVLYVLIIKYLNYIDPQYTITVNREQYAKMQSEKSTRTHLNRPGTYTIAALELHDIL